MDGETHGRDDLAETQIFPPQDEAHSGDLPGGAGAVNAAGLPGRGGSAPSGYAGIGRPDVVAPGASSGVLSAPISPGAPPSASAITPGVASIPRDRFGPDDDVQAWLANSAEQKVVTDPVDVDEVEPRRTMPVWQELPLLLLVAFCLAVLMRTFLLQAFYIPSGSMETTLLVGDRVVVNKIVYDVRQPARGEVVVFRGTDNWAPENPPAPPTSLVGRVGRTIGDLVGVSRPGEKDIIKRVIGLPGDRVSCCDPDGRIYVNGKGIDEPYISVNSPLEIPPNPRACGSRRFDEVLVPPGQLFVMGDHRVVSQDSRCQGTVPIDSVIGRAFAIVWPSGRWATLSVPPELEDVPGPVAMGPAPPTPASPGLGFAAVAGPILASLGTTARSGRRRRWGRRTLPR